jgi:hypothetical protein
MLKNHFSDIEIAEMKAERDLNIKNHVIKARKDCYLNIFNEAMMALYPKEKSFPLPVDIDVNHPCIQHLLKHREQLLNGIHIEDSEETDALRMEYRLQQLESTLLQSNGQ